MSHEDYQRIVDQGIENHDLTEAEFIASKLYFDWRDIYTKADWMGPRYFPKYLRKQWTDDEFWDMHVEYQTPILRAAYAKVLADKDDYLLWKNDWKTWMAQQRAKATKKPAQTTLWEGVAA